MQQNFGLLLHLEQMKMRIYLFFTRFPLKKKLGRNRRILLYEIINDVSAHTFRNQSFILIKHEMSNDVSSHINSFDYEVLIK